jgi:hypothetical protein
MPKSKLLCLPRDAVEGVEELAVVREELHYRKQLIRIARDLEFFWGNGPLIFRIICGRRTAS